MSHSKGLFAGTCPGNFRKVNKPRNGYQQYKCGRCGRLKRKRARKCFLFHDYQNSGNPDHGHQKQKCEKCADVRDAYVSGCGLFRSCRWHMCDKVPGMHCARCARRRA